MNLTITNQTCEDIVFNGHYLEKLYYNEHLVWEKQHAPVNPYASQYFTIESLEDNNSVTLAKSNSNAPTINAYYSLDNGTTWTQHATSAEKTWVLNTGNKLLIKATTNAWESSSGRNYFSSTKQFDVYGNTMSLLYGDNFVNQTTLNSDGRNLANLFYNATKLKNAENLILPATTLRNECYAHMFWGCTSLTTAPELPATTLADSCYFDMFLACTSLTKAPALPATTVAPSCYEAMFYGCSSLVDVPDLPATVLANTCYKDMFYECTSLTTAPKLPAKTLAIYCYHYMFYRCISLNEVVCLATNISASNCTTNWLYGVSSTGTFVKDSSMSSWSSGSSGIPSGWTVQNN